MGNYVRDEYHESDVRDSRFCSRTKKEGKLVGVELEVECEDGFGEVLDAVPDFETDGPAMERDGSLNDSYGVEIIFPPIPADRITQARSTVARTMSAISKLNLNLSSGTGMHVSINCSDWSDNKAYRYIMAYHWLPREMIERVGGRRLTHYCYQDRTLAEDERSIYLYENPHELVAERDGYRIELRYPQATTDITRLAKVLTLSDMIEEWADSTNATDWDDKEQAILDGVTAVMRRNRRRTAVQQLAELMQIDLDPST